MVTESPYSSYGCGMMKSSVPPYCGRVTSRSEPFSSAGKLGGELTDAKLSGGRRIRLNKYGTVFMVPIASSATI